MDLRISWSEDWSSALTHLYPCGLLDFCFIQWVIVCCCYYFDAQIVSYLASGKPFKLADFYIILCMSPSFFELLFTFWHKKDVPDSCYFSALALETAISSRTPGYIELKLYFETVICALGMFIATEVLLPGLLSEQVRNTYLCIYFCLYIKKPWVSLISGTSSYCPSLENTSVIEIGEFFYLEEIRIKKFWM